MKKPVLTIVFIALLTLTTLAQLEKGSWIGGVSGNVGFSFRSSTRVFSCSINPYAMYLVKRNFALGLSLEDRYYFINNTYQYEYLDKYSSNTLVFAPVVRKYFGNSKYRSYAGIATGWTVNYSKSRSAETSQVSKGTDFRFFLNPEAGISYWLNDKVFFDLKASYDLINNNLSGYHTVDLKMGIGIKLGDSSPEK